MLKVLHIEDRFHPEMGYQPNFFARYHSRKYKFYLLSSDSFNIWEGSGISENIEEKDKTFGKKNNIEIIRLPAVLARRNKNNLWLKGLLKSIYKINPDIIYAHCIESFTSLRIILSRKTLSRYRFYFDTHTLLNQFNRSLRFRFYIWIIRHFISRRVNKRNIKIFATVPENIEILKNIYRINPANIFYSPIGTDLETFHFDFKSRKTCREKFNVKEEDIALLYTGKMNLQKSPHLILQALKFIEAKIQRPLHLFFIGPAQNRYIQEYFYVKLNSENIHLHLLPAVPVHELYQWYSMADFAVFPNENSLSAMDAQACHLPVIMGKDETNCERLKKGGLVYQKCELGDLAEKILLFIQDDQLRRKMGEAGAEYVKQKYDYKIITRNMEAEMGVNDL